jgi:hypothetical protein
MMTIPKFLKPTERADVADEIESEIARLVPRRSEMERALAADGKKLRHLTGEDHGPWTLPDEAPRRAMTPEEDRVYNEATAMNAGQLSAEAMEGEFQKTAKDIERLGVELIDVAKKCEGAMTYLQKTIEHLNDTADYYRKEAKRIHGEIEAYASLAEDVRRQSELMRQRLVAGEPMPKPEIEQEKPDASSDNR